MLHEKKGAHKSIFIFALLLALYEIATYLSNDAYLPALPAIVKDLGTSQQLIQLSLTTWFMGSGTMQLFLGPIADRFGRRPVLLSGGLFFIVSTIGCALTHSIYTLLALRFIEGATIASMIIAGYATIHESCNQKEAIHTLAIMSSITILAPAFGPLLGAIFLYITNWRWIFGILAVWATLTISGLFFKMPETKKEVSEKMQFKRIFKQYKNIICNKSFMLFELTGQCFFATVIAWIVAGPFLIIEQFHLTTLDYGILQTLVFGSFIIGTRLVKRLMESLQLKTIVKMGITFLLLGSSYALISSILWPSVLWNTIIAMMLISIGTGLAFPVLKRLSVESSTEPMGSRMAISSFLMGISSTLASIIMSRIYNGSLLSLAEVLIALSILSPALQYLNKNHK